MVEKRLVLRQKLGYQKNHYFEMEMCCNLADGYGARSLARVRVRLMPVNGGHDEWLRGGTRRT